MKKTLTMLACAALVAPAFADVTVDDLTTYTATFANSRSATQGSARSHLLLDGGESAITLNSWMIEFDITKGSDIGTFFSTSRNGASSAGGTTERGGLGVRTDSATGLRLTTGANSVFTGDKLTIPTITTASASAPITLRMAYDAEAGEAYLCYVGSDAPSYVTATVAKDAAAFYLSSVDKTVTGNGDKDGKSMFWTDGGAQSFTLKGVTDLSLIAGDSDKFVQYVTTKTLPIATPEPATATLSLLALAGLAARRRRH